MKKLSDYRIREFNGKFSVQTKFEAAGGVYLIVRSFDDFLEQFEQYI